MQTQQFEPNSLATLYPVQDNRVNEMMELFGALRGMVYFNSSTKRQAARGKETNLKPQYNLLVFEYGTNAAVV